MMTNDVLPWEGIKIPADEFNLLRSSPDHSHNFFWGRDAAGHYLLVLKCKEVDSQEGFLRRNLDFKPARTIPPGKTLSQLLLEQAREEQKDRIS